MSNPTTIWPDLKFPPINLYSMPKIAFLIEPAVETQTVKEIAERLSDLTAQEKSLKPHD